MAVETLDEALKSVDGMLSDSDRRKIRKLVQQWGVEGAITQLHHGLGTKIRNELMLWGPEGEELRNDVWERTSPERQEYYRGWWEERGDPCPGGHYMHPDDCSTEIIRAYLERLMELEIR